jgi:hypothetical protein
MTVLAQILNVRPHGDDIPNIYDPASHRSCEEKFSKKCVAGQFPIQVVKVRHKD